MKLLITEVYEGNPEEKYYYTPGGAKGIGTDDNWNIKPDISNDQLVDLLDKFGYFPEDTIPEIIELIKNQYVKPLNCFKQRLHYKKFTISREKGQSYIDDISKATMDLEPKTNQSPRIIIQYANEVKELLNKIHQLIPSFRNLILIKNNLKIMISRVTKRVRYSAGKLVKKEDFEEEQNNTLDDR